MNKIKKLFFQSNLLSTKHSKYFDIYDEIFRKYKNKKITFVEIGVFQGGSLDIWKKYFGKKAKIIGIDLNPKCKQFEKKGIKVFIGNQSDKLFWKKFFKTVGKVDIILDDGGHTNENQIITLVNTTSHIKNGGVLVTEDTHTSYDKSFGNPHKYSFINFSKKIIDDINYTYPFFPLKKFKLSLNKFIYKISFFESIVAFYVDRSKCYQNRILHNKGEDSGIEDFRHSDSSLINLMSKIRKNSKFFKKIKLYKINYFIKNLFLKKYFK